MNLSYFSNSRFLKGKENKESCVEKAYCHFDRGNISMQVILFLLDFVAMNDLLRSSELQKRFQSV